MKNIIRYILTVSFSAYCILGAVLYIFQDSFLYFPSKDIKIHIQKEFLQVKMKA